MKPVIMLTVSSKPSKHKDIWSANVADLLYFTTFKYLYIYMIYITGDTHHDWVTRLKTKNFPEQKEMTKDDYVVILGDFGIWENSKQEKYMLDWLEDRPFTTLVIDGNHDNHDILKAMPIDSWSGGKVHFIRPSVIHLMRGQVFNIAGKSVFTFGGAQSHDIQDGILEPSAPDFKQQLAEKRRYTRLFRINHVSWWKEELPSKEEMDEGFKNLEKHGNKVDWIFTHAAPLSVAAYLGFSGRDILSHYLQAVKEKVEYKKWFFGHLHDNKNIYHENCILLYEQIIRIL